MVIVLELSLKEKGPRTSFETKDGLRQIFPRGGKSSILPQAIITPFSQALHFMEKLAILRERETVFKGKLSPRDRVHAKGVVLCEGRVSAF